MKTLKYKLNATVFAILLVFALLKSDAACFNGKTGPTDQGTDTVRVTKMAACSNGSCPYYGAPPETCSVSATVQGQTLTKYSLSATSKYADFGLTVGWEQTVVNGQSGTVTKTWTAWCTAHNADTAQDINTKGILYFTSCNGVITSSQWVTLTTVTAYYPRAYGVPDENPPSPCNPICPPQG